MSPSYAGKAILFVFDGQSLALNPTTAQAFPALVKANYPGSVGIVAALGGTSWSDRSPSAAGRVDKYLRSTSVGKRVFIDCGGTKDINDGLSAATIKTNMEAYWQARIDAGWDLVVATTIPDASSLQDAGEPAIRDTTNDNIAASLKLDAVADFRTAGTIFEDYTNTTYYQGDQLHPTATGASEMSTIIIAALDTLGI